MASPFNVELSMPEPPAEAQARAASDLTQPARDIGFRLTKRSAGELQYRPLIQFPWLARLLWHTVSGEKMTVTFAPGESGGTRVTISGAVARGKQPLAADDEHWSDALTG